jgi:cell division protein FtsZ
MSTRLFNNRFVLHAEDTFNQRAVIKVIGVGGGGSNAVDHMVNEEIEGVEFFVANTDVQALTRARVLQKVQLGTELTKGLGAGSNPQLGREAAIEDKEKLVEFLGNADMIFITAGMGGGTGTGAAPEISKSLKEANPNILVVAVVTTPFEFEGKKRMAVANEGLKDLKSAVDSLITIPNEKILDDINLTLKDAYGKVNDVLLNAVQGIADLVVRPGYINVDFADVRTVMSEAGSAMMGSGRASGDNRATMATRAAIENPLLADVDVSNAKGILINITGSSVMSPQELKDIARIVEEVASEDATVIMGQVYDDDLEDEIRVTIVATGLNDQLEDQLEDQPEQYQSPPANCQTAVGRGSIYVESDMGQKTAVEEDTLPAVLRNRSGVIQPTHEKGNGLAGRPKIFDHWS